MSKSKMRSFRLRLSCTQQFPYVASPGRDLGELEDRALGQGLIELGLHLGENPVQELGLEVRRCEVRAIRDLAADAVEGQVGLRLLGEPCYVSSSFSRVIRSARS